MVRRRLGGCRAHHAEEVEARARRGADEASKELASLESKQAATTSVVLETAQELSEVLSDHLDEFGRARMPGFEAALVDAAERLQDVQDALRERWEQRARGWATERAALLEEEATQEDAAAAAVRAAVHAGVGALCEQIGPLGPAEVEALRARHAAMGREMVALEEQLARADGAAEERLEAATTAATAAERERGVASEAALRRSHAREIESLGERLAAHLRKGGGGGGGGALEPQLLHAELRVVGRPFPSDPSVNAARLTGIHRCGAVFLS
eukprot:COSAG01_NODE_3615_length_5864_cov_26.705984_4_plen_271_part_00